MSRARQLPLPTPIVRRWWSFGVVLTVALLLAVPTLQAYQTVYHVHALDFEVTDYAVSEDGERLEVTLAVANPNPTAVSLETAASTGRFHVYDGDRRVSTLQDTAIDGATIPPRDSAAVTVSFTVAERYRGDIRDRLASGELRLAGTLDAVVVDRPVGVKLHDEEVTADADA